MKPPTATSPDLTGPFTLRWRKARSSKKPGPIVSSLAEASDATQMHRDGKGWGRRGPMLRSASFNGCDVLNDYGKIVAEVSYNGRVWEHGTFPTPEILVEGSYSKAAYPGPLS